MGSDAVFMLKRCERGLKKLHEMVQRFYVLVLSFPSRSPRYKSASAPMRAARMKRSARHMNLPQLTG